MIWGMPGWLFIKNWRNQVMEPWGGHKVWRLGWLDMWGMRWFNCFHYPVPGAVLIWAQILLPAVQVFLFKLLYREHSLPALSLALAQRNCCSDWVKKPWTEGWVSAVGMQESAYLSALRISVGNPSQPSPVMVNMHLFIQTECIDSLMLSCCLPVTSRTREEKCASEMSRKFPT